ncbi:MAG: hypothetical protein AAGE52_27945 [Myxococcota bacterium]
MQPVPMDATSGSDAGSDAGGADVVDSGTDVVDSGPSEIAWAGTWTVHATYDAVCRFSTAGGPNNVDADFRVTAQISGGNDMLSAVFSGDTGYTMEGSGSARRMTLSGPFPGRDHNGNTATIVRRDNNVTIAVTDVIDSNTAQGTIEGRYDTRGGIGCEIESGTVELTR